MMNRLRALSWAGIMRVSGFLMLLSFGAVFVGARWVDAQMGELLHGLGAELMAYPRSRTEFPRAVYVNGARFFLRTTTVGAPVEEVLDHYQALCEGRDAGLSVRLSELAGDGLGQGPFNTRRSGGPSGGHVSCLDLGEAEVDALSLLDRLLLFAKTGDSSQVGAFRYAFARPTDDDPKQSFLLTMWTEGPVSLLDLLPLNGSDVPGRDPWGLPRPPGMQRILSAWQSDEPYGLTLYSTRGRSGPNLAAFYQREFSKRGWKLLDPLADKPLVVGKTRVLGFERDGQMVTVLLNDTLGSSQTATVLTTE